jgi:hypothetical protein
MQALGGRASLAFNSEPDIKEWANQVALNPARIPPGQAVDGDLGIAIGRFHAAVNSGIAAMSELARLTPRNGEPQRFKL